MKRVLKKIIKKSNRTNYESGSFDSNEVFFNKKRIYSASDAPGYSLNIVGKNNNLNLMPILGPGIVNIFIEGDSNSVVFGKGCRVNNHLSINFWGVTNKLPQGASILIGNGNYFNGSNISFISPVNQNGKIQIGENNLFAGNILFRGRNDHAVFDVNTGKRINIDGNIKIGSDNWICDNVTFGPKSKIMGQSVVASNSLVNKEFQENNILLAGMPALIKKKNVSWAIDPNASYKSNVKPIKNQ